MKGLKNILLKKLIIYSYIFLSIFTQPLLAAGVVRDQNRNQQMNVEKAPNGVPIVNINAPNNNGVSHNYFKEYNVEKEGILLNNSAKEFNRTQIGGIIQGNSNLNGKEANVILTEVTGVNRSKIEGYTEIVGKSAEYILANPNGIYLNGAGFINTPRVILTTGKSITDELGDLKGFSVDDGTVVIGSQGIDGKNVRMVDIISRTAELNGAVYGGEEVNVVLGRNDYDHQTKKVTPKAEKAGEKPKVALDAKALGSLYAGRIYLQSTEKGVGVNSQGEMLAGAGDFEVDVNGRLILNDAQAKNDIKIKAENVEIQKRAVAENNININTKDIVNTGAIAANKNINVKSSNIENKGSISSKSITIANKEKIVNTGKISADSVKISSNDMENKELTVVNADIDLTGNLKTESMKAVENLSIKGKSIENTGTMIANKKVKIESTNLSNKGDISADEIKINNQNNIVNEKNIIGLTTEIVSSSIENKGLIQGDILALSIINNVENSGNVAGKELSLSIGNLINTSTIYGENQLKINAASIENNGLQSNIGGKSLTNIHSGTLTNTGKVSSEYLTLNINSILTNAGILYAENLKINTVALNNNNDINSKISTDISADNLTSTGNIISEGKLNLEGIQINNSGNILADNINIKSSNFINSGEVQSDILKLDSLISILNKGNLVSKDLNIKSKNIENTGTIYGDLSLVLTSDKYINKNSAITAGNILTLNSIVENDGNILGEKVTFTGTEIKNTENITGEDTLHITSDLNNTGTVQGKNLVSIIGNIDNSQNIKSEKVLNISGNIINTGYIYGENADVVGNITNSGDILSLSNMKISGNIINNKNLNSGDKLTLLSSNILNNDRISALALSITGVKLVNNGMITGEKGIFNIDNIENYGTLYGKNTLSITGNNLINNKLIQGSNDLYISSQIIENKDDLFAGNNISLIAISLDNIGRIIGDGNLTFNTSNLFTNSNLIQGNNIKIAGIDNSGKIVAKEGIEAVEIKNSGTISALKSLKSNKLLNLILGKTILGENLTLEEELLNKGIISVKGDITAKNISNTGSIVSDKNIVLKELDNSSGTIEGKNINIVNTGLFNNQSGKLKVFDNDSILYIKALDINNNLGEVHAQGTADLNIAGNLILTGSYIGNTLLKITADSLTSNINLENGGDIVLNLSGDFLNNNKFISGNNITITAKDLINNKTLGSLRNFVVNLSGKLDNLDSMILGNGNNIITTAGDINNSGFLTSQNSLTVNSKDLINNGQIASGNILNLNSNNITNNNFALLYSKENMFITAKKDFFNNKGDIYSGNNVEIKALGKVQNNTATIEAIGDIYIEAAQIENLGEITGSHSVIGKVPASAVTTNVTQQEKDKIKNKFLKLIAEMNEGKNNKYDKAHFDSMELEWIDKIESNYTSKMAYISSGKNITLKTTGDVINRESNILADKDVNISAVNLKNENFVVDITTNSQWKAKYYTYVWEEGGSGNNDNNGTAGGHWTKIYHKDLKLTEPFIQKMGTDKATKISAGNKINISAVQVGNGVQSRDSNTVNSKNVNVGQVILNSSNVGKTGTINTENYITIPEGDKGLFVVNKDLVNSARVSIIDKDNKVDKIISDSEFKEKIAVGNGELVFNNNSISNDKAPGFSYLIESNVKFTDMGYYMGSDYFFGKIGFNPEKNIRLLGDAFYESRVVNRAILESTGKRYLNGAANEKEQMQILLDNSIKAMEDFNLSIGTALTKEQINNLKSDIIWYVEEEVNGVNVLVPKVYLSKETLASLGNNQTGMMAGNGINISAVEVNNTGSIKSSGSITINAEKILNKSVLGDFKALIAGNDIEIVSVNDIKNIGAEISADNNISLESIKGSIWNKSTLRENTNLNGIVISNFEDSGEIKAGNDIIISANNNFVNSAGALKANNNIAVSSNDIVLDTIQLNNSTNKKNYQKETIENIGGHISSNNVTLTADNNIEIKGSVVKGINGVALSGNEIKIESAENYSYEKDGSGKNYTIREKVNNIGSTVTGKNISISADKNINIKGSDVIADSELRLKAGEDVNLTASIDSDYYEHQESKKKSFGRGKSKTEVKYTTSHNGANLIGENVSIKSGKDTVIIGSNIQAGPEGSAVINAGGDIVQAAVKDINYSYKKTTKTGFLGLTGSSKSTEQYKEEAVKSNTISGIGGTSYDAGNGILLEGVTVVSTGNITLKGKEVSINPVETQAYQEEIKKKKGFSSSFSGGTASFSYGKSKDEIKTTQTTNTASTIVSQGKVDIEATEGKAVLKSVDIYGETGIDIKGHEGVELIVAKDKTTVDEKHKSSSIGISAGVASSIKTTIDNVRDIDKLTDFGGNSYDIANTASDLVGAIKEGAEAFSKIKNDGQQENNSSPEGMKVISTDINSYITVNAGVNKSKSEYHSSSESTVKNKLESKGDINISSGAGSVIIEGTDIKTEKDLNLSASKDVVVKSSKDEYSSSSSSSSKGLNADLTVSTNPETSLLGSVTASQSKGKGNSEGTINVNSKFEVGGTHKVEAGEKVIYEGANVEAGRVKIKGEEVIIASSKDTEKSSSKNSSSSIKVSQTPVGVTGELNLSQNKSNGEKEWVSNQTTIIAKEGGIIESKDFTNSGAIIGSKSEENKLIVKAENITVEHLKDKDTNKVSGGGINIKGTGVPNLSIVTGGQDKRQDTNATTVNTDFIVKGDNKTAEELGFNTDLSKAQVITKDEDKILDAELHTDLLNKSEREKIADLGVNLSEIIQSIVNSDSGGVLNTYKAHKYGRLLEAHINKDPRYKGLLGDPNISIEDKQRVLNAAVNTFLTSRGYKGPKVDVLIGEESLSTRGKIVISKEKLNGLSFLEDLGHELGHLVSYDDGNEDTAKIVEGKMGTLEETDTQGKYNDYLEILKEEYKNLKTEEETREWLATIPDNEKERLLPLIIDLGFSSQTAGTPDIVETNKIETKDGQLYYNGNKVIILDEMKDGRVVVTPIQKDFILEQIEGAVLGETAGAILKIGGKWIITTSGGKYVVSKSGKVIGKLKDIVKLSPDQIEVLGKAVDSSPSGSINATKVFNSGVKIPVKSAENKKLVKEIIEKGDIKGELTEKLVNNLAKEKKYKLLEGKYGSNNGIDHIFFSKDGKSLIILDSKQMKGNGSFQLLPKGAGGNVQLSKKWIEAVADNIKDPATKKLLKNNLKNGQIKTGVIGVDKKTGDLILVPVNTK
ncbi:hemagglutinin repeat-containing protein [Fusobacterium varium]|uniref:two-partner secretion domain-containing protein n=1 Tax=Fusobacterium varium TaxID=856 RepID=UPI002FF274B5